MSSDDRPIICEEIFDETSHPSVDEIVEYATKIGIDPESEPQLLPIAAEGLMKALPTGWRPCYHEKSKSYYYYNNLNGKTQWEHPLDDVYRSIVIKKRTESQSLSQGELNEDATYTREDLPSYEEPPHLAVFVPKSIEPLSSGARKKEIRLSPLKSRMKPSEVNRGEVFYPKLIKQKSEDHPTSMFRKLNIHRFNSFDDNKGDTLNKIELKVTGGGSKFLKLNTKAADSRQLSPQSKENHLSPDTHHPRSILRERAFMENSRSMEFTKSNDRSDKDEDDKKSVRFNFDNNPDITIDFSSRSLSEEDLKEIRSETNEIINVCVSNKTKSRFTVSPVTENISVNNVVENDEQRKEPSNLKLIKPSPKDFIKPKLKSSESIDESDDDSFTKQHENKIRLSKNLQQSTDDEIVFKTISIKKDRSRLIKGLNEEVEKELEMLKKTLWEEKNVELQKYKEQIEISHKLELERVLVEEKSKYEEKIRTEVENLRKEMENRAIGTLKEERLKCEFDLDAKKVELEDDFKDKRTKLEETLQQSLEFERNDIVKTNREKIELLERELNEQLDKHKDELIVSHNAILDQMKQKHINVLEELKDKFTSEELLIQKQYQNQLVDVRKKCSVDREGESNKSKDSCDDRMYEKVRCEKRLLEDKYRCLKEKYLRLKTDVKLTIEKRNKRREQSLTTGSETERSNSMNKERSPIHSPSPNRHSNKPPTPKHSRSNHKDVNRLKSENKVTHQMIIQDMDTSVSDHSFKANTKYKNDDSSDNNSIPGRSRKKLFSRLKSSSTSRLNSNAKQRKSQRSCSPVENLRRQLQTLEDLEDQFPQNTHTDTYHLRYPFTDDQKFEGSSELEFFRHRIHLERDSIKRAKESLRSQRCLFQQRQKELKMKHGTMARYTLQQLCQEEKELTDMEVSLHRTRSLLGEKVIRLRHLEQSLQRASISSDQSKTDDTATLSDLSSHSASSGISSTEFATADNVGTRTVLRAEHFQESSEIIQSLENLNSEIREIWEVLHKQQQQQSININSVVPSLPLVYPDLGWPVLAGTTPPVPAPPSIPTLADRLHNYRQHLALANAQSTVVTHATQGATTTLVERTRNLKHWLRQAGIDSVNDGGVSQATL